MLREETERKVKNAGFNGNYFGVAKKRKNSSSSGFNTSRCVNVLNDWACEKILAPLMQQQQIFLKHNFCSQNFLLEHQKIEGFCGRMNANFKGDNTTNRLLGLLLEYANYTGIGIKTALGMGAVKTKLKFNHL